MSAVWRGNWATRTRIVTGLVLLVYVFFHFVNIGIGLVSPAWSEAFQDARQIVTRSLVGSVLIYGALLAHAALALGKVAFRSNLRLQPWDAVQIVLGLTIPLMLATHIVYTRASHEIFATHDTVSYIAALIWNHPDGWKQAGLLLITWTHGCMGLHFWLRLTSWWRRILPWFIGAATLVPGFALAGFMVEGRRAKALLAADEDTMLDFFDATNWPGPADFDALASWSGIAFWISVALLSLTALIYLARVALRPRRTLRISYVDGPTISTAPGPTLLEISQAAGVPHTALCGGRGRCTTCRVVIEAGTEDLPAPSAAETRALEAVNAAPGTRLACQLRPTDPATVYRVFRPDGRRDRAHASQGRETQLAILFLDMRGFTARTTGQLPYDVVFLLNRFFDAIVPEITGAGGTVDKYMGDGLLAVFETRDAASSARAALTAAAGIDAALGRFNETLRAEGAPEVRIGIGLHLGTLVLGEIGAAGQSARTLIGDSVNTASRLEGQTKELGAQVLISQPLLEAAGHSAQRPDMVTLNLRGRAEPLRALPVPHDRALEDVLTTLPA